VGLAGANGRCPGGGIIGLGGSNKVSQISVKRMFWVGHPERSVLSEKLPVLDCDSARPIYLHSILIKLPDFYHLSCFVPFQTQIYRCVVWYPSDHRK